MLTKIGLWILGLTSLTCFVLAALGAIFANTLTSLYPTPPVWARYIVLALCISGVLGFIVGITGLLIDE